jgi:hypothetical protein
MRKAAARETGGGFFMRLNARRYGCTGINAVFVRMDCLDLIHVAARIAALAGMRGFSRVSRGVCIMGTAISHFVKYSPAVENGFLAAGVTITVAAVLQSVAIVLASL